MMTNSAGDLKKAEQIASTFMALLEMPNWTPAMGALVATGIVPIPNCAEIPKAACLIRDVSQSATGFQLYQAEKVLTRWVEDHTDDDDEPALPNEVAPLEFVMWCQDSYAQVHEEQRPEALGHLLSLVNVPDKSKLSPPVPLSILKRAIALENHATIEAETSPKLKLGRFAKRAAYLCGIGKLKAKIAPQIGHAQDRCPSAPFQATQVYLHLVEMAKNGESLALRHENDQLLAPRGDDDWVPYKLKTLQEYLQRNKKLLLADD